MKDYKKYSEATICGHMKGKIDDSVVDNRKYNKGRPEKLTERDKRNIIRQVEILRRDYGYFTTKRLKFLLAYPRMFQMKQLGESSEQMG